MPNLLHNVLIQPHPSKKKYKKALFVQNGQKHNGIWRPYGSVDVHTFLSLSCVVERSKRVRDVFTVPPLLEIRLGRLTADMPIYDICWHLGVLSAFSPTISPKCRHVSLKY